MHDVLAYPRVAARIFDVPLLVERSKLNVILGALGDRMQFDTPAPADGVGAHHATPESHEQALISEAAMKNVPLKRAEAGYWLAGDVAVIPIIGTLVQRSDWMSESSGMVGYGRIASRFAAALDDPNVREIMLEIDSPGGEVAGAFDLADGIYAARGTKPILAVASELAASAAYLIASAADEIVVPRTGYVGSVGVVAAHYDYSKQLEKRGVAVTLLYAGEKKVDGNPFAPLDERVRDEWMTEIKSVYGLFVNTVARNLGISPGRVASTEAGTFMGTKAVDAGFAHRVNTLANELGNAMLRASAGGGSRSNLSTSTKGNIMTEQEKQAAAEQAAKARAEALAEGERKGEATAEKKAADERTRVKAILESPEAEGRDALARQLAFGTTLSADDAIASLKVAPKEKKAGPLASAMDGKNPSGVAPDQPDPTDAPARKIDGRAIFKRRAEQVAHAKRNGIQ